MHSVESRAIFLPLLGLGCQRRNHAIRTAEDRRPHARRPRRMAGVEAELRHVVVDRLGRGRSAASAASPTATAGGCAASGTCGCFFGRVEFLVAASGRGRARRAPPWRSNTLPRNRDGQVRGSRNGDGRRLDSRGLYRRSPIGLQSCAESGRKPLRASSKLKPIKVVAKIRELICLLYRSRLLTIPATWSVAVCDTVHTAHLRRTRGTCIPKAERSFQHAGTGAG